MRIPVIAGGVALCAGIIIGAQTLTAPVSASAQTEAVAILSSTTEEVRNEALRIDAKDDNDVIKVAVDSVVDSMEKKNEVKEDKEIVHKVKPGESLERIAKEYDIEDWTRLYDKNTELENPDFLEIGQKLDIPHEEEEIEDRELPQQVVEVVETVDPANEQPAQAASQTTTRTTQSSTSSTPAPVKRARTTTSTSGNLYSYGYCTWHVKNKRPDLPNNLGNANTWFARASAQGYATGYSPRVGAAAEATTGYMHVAYVTAVHGDGTITVSEMNFKGWGVQSSRRVASNQFRYIYN